MRRNRPLPYPMTMLRFARYYQPLLDSGKVENRAALARFLGVSRARLTQVLNRLKDEPHTPAETGRFCSDAW